MQTTKPCNTCKVHKDLDQFSKSSCTKDGKQHTCKKCAAEKTRKYYRQNDYREAASKRATEKKDRLKSVFDKIREINGCALCSERAVCALDYHHIDPSQKEGEVSKFMYQHNGPKMIAEMRKCAVVCKNCHSKVHAKLRTTTKKHLCRLPEEVIGLI